MENQKSSNILFNTDNLLAVNILSFQRMAQNKKEDLADYVSRVRVEKGLTTQDVAERSGGTITRGYVSHIENRHSINVTPNKLKALAKGLGVPVEEVFSKARGSKSEQDEAEFQESLYFMLYKKSRNVSPDKKEFIQKILQMIDRELEEDTKARN
jgi:transcriptional regulator with XRE-family HTH domain